MDLAKQVKCPQCGADLGEVGVSVDVRETRLYIRTSGEAGLVRIGSVGAAEIERAQCRCCFSVLPVKCTEMLRVA
jgi:hypothetical protein